MQLIGLICERSRRNLIFPDELFSRRLAMTAVKLSHEIKEVK